MPAVTKTSEAAAADWQAAVDLVASEGEAKAARRAAGNGSPTLNRSTLDFIRDGAGTGDRHRLLVFRRREPCRVSLSAAAGRGAVGRIRARFGIAAERRSPADRVRTCRRRFAFVAGTDATGCARIDASRLGRLDSQGTAGSRYKRFWGP